MPHPLPGLDALAGHLPPWMPIVGSSDLAARTLSAVDVQTWLFPLYVDSERWANLRRLLHLTGPAPWWRGPVPAPLLIYGLPRSLVASAGLRVDAGLCCGYWRLKAVPALCSSELRALLSSCERTSPVLACFGSVMALGTISVADIESILLVLKAVARRCARPVLLVLHPACLPLLEETATFSVLQRQSTFATPHAGQLFVDAPNHLPFPVDWLAVYCGQDVLLDDLLPLCSAAVHHGGSGTTASCWLAGVPQVVLPMMFDQPSWARAVVSTGTGVSPCELDDVLAASDHCFRGASAPGGGVTFDCVVSALSSAVIAATSAAVVDRCKRMRDQLASRHDGVAEAADSVNAFVVAWRASRASASRATRARLDDVALAHGGPFLSVHLEVFETDAAAGSSEHVASCQIGPAFEAHLTVELPPVDSAPAVPVCVIVDCGGPEEVGLIAQEIFEWDTYFSVVGRRIAAEDLLPGVNMSTSFPSLAHDSSLAISQPLLPWPRHALQAHRSSERRQRFRVVDVGANIGLFGLRCWLDAFAYCRGDSEPFRGEEPEPVELEILAVEPVQRTARMLIANLERAGCAVRRWKGEAGVAASARPLLERTTSVGFEPMRYGLSWTCLVAQCALSDPATVAAARLTQTGGSAGTVAMRVWPRILGNATMQPLEKMREKGAMHSPEQAERLFKHGYTESVPVSTLSELLCSASEDCAYFRPPGPCLAPVATVGATTIVDHLDIDLLKVDVEGCELRVLRGIDDASWQRIRMVSIEVHDVGTRMRDVLELLTAPLSVATTGTPRSDLANEFAAGHPRVTATSDSGVAKAAHPSQSGTSGAGFSPACVFVHRPANLPADANNFHVFAWRSVG